MIFLDGAVVVALSGAESLIKASDLPAGRTRCQAGTRRVLILNAQIMCGFGIRQV